MVGLELAVNIEKKCFESCQRLCKPTLTAEWATS